MNTNEDATRGPSVYDQHNCADAISAKTRSYHRKLLGIASSPSNTSSLAWDCTQHVLDQIMWDGGAADYGKRQNNNVEGRRIVYACQVCGHFIHPGFQGTSLRVDRSSVTTKTTKSKTTLRRRQQRRKRKQSLSKLRDAKDSNRPKKQQHKQSSDDIEASDSVSVVLLEDDPNLILDRHHLAIRCGRCRSKVLLKGLKQDKSKVGIEHPTSNTSTKNDFRKQQKHKKIYEVAHRKDQTSVVEDPNEFMKLPPSSAAAAKSTKMALLPTPGRKKKKKPDTSKSNKLMSFLNSLND